MIRIKRDEKIVIRCTAREKEIIKTLAKSEKMRFPEKQKGRKNWTGKQN